MSDKNTDKRSGPPMQGASDRKRKGKVRNSTTSDEASNNGSDHDGSAVTKPKKASTVATSIPRKNTGRAMPKMRKSTGPLAAWRQTLSHTASIAAIEEDIGVEREHEPRSEAEDEETKVVWGQAAPGYLGLTISRVKAVGKGGQKDISGSKEAIDKAHRGKDVPREEADRPPQKLKLTLKPRAEMKSTVQTIAPTGSVKKSSTTSVRASATQGPILGAEGTSVPSAALNDSIAHLPPGWTVEEFRARNEFMRALRASDYGSTRPLVGLRNVIDHETPAPFTFISQNVLGDGVSRADDAAMSGCVCRPENGRHVGCEYTSCQCLEQAAVKSDGRRRFPYYCTGRRNECLQDFYLSSRNHIFECNRLCNCPPHCKNKVVLRGRTVRLEIFKTENRGWGLRTLDPLRKGQFIDTYKGEIITSEEADRREAARHGKDVYLYTLDKFAGTNGIELDDCYIVDGEHMGGVCRYMNHSCAPNCRQFTVSWNHADAFVYDVALFALCDVPAGTELTFNYVDAEDLGEPDEKELAEQGKMKTECLCGAPECRKWLWI
ncbi:MAG: hypothetical protein M1816_008144 [Peltula sp. TS41687]|nr:MAG: hypothetical protein M1816_008144 [Peltula sp. TS41687]